MDVRIRLFAQLRELMGCDVLLERFEGDAVTAAALRRRLAESRPRLRPHLETLALAINEEYCADPDAEIRAGDEVALIQPVSGGADGGPGGGAPPPFLVTAAALDREALRGLVADPASGAVVLFEGVVRNHHEGRAVARLEYEAYAPMAERQLEEAAREVLAEFADRGVRRIVAHHRTGALEVGETSLLVAVSAAHRGDAFAAALRAVDRIKETVPVWKREHGPDGAAWQEGARPRPAAARHPPDA